MKPSTHTPLSSEQLISTSTASVQTATIPLDASAILISVETTSARMTFTNVAPDSTHGQVFPAGVSPLLLVLGSSGTTLKFASTGATSSIVNLTYLR